MTGEQTLLARGGLGVAGAVAGMVLVSLRRLRTLSNLGFGRFALLGMVLSRVGLFAFIFIALHLAVRGDIPGYYWDEARNVLHGLLPYRDFQSSYAPLHPYLDAAVIRLWYSQLSIIALAIVAECVMLPIWLGISRRLFPEQEVRTAVLLYLASPVSFTFVSVDGQDNVIIALLLAGAVALIIRRMDGLSGTLAGLAASTIKFLPLLFAPAFFFATPRRWRWTAGIVAVLALVYGGALTLHLPINQPITVEGGIRSCGNIPYLVESATGLTLSAKLWDGLVLLLLAGIYLFVARLVRGQNAATRLLAIVFAMPAITFALVDFSKKGWPNYLMLALFPVCLLARRMRGLRLTLFTAFGVVAVVEHSYWATILHQWSAPTFHAALIGLSKLPATEQRFVLGHVVLELLIVAGYTWLLVLSMRALASVRRLPAGSPALTEMEVGN